MCDTLEEVLTPRQIEAYHVLMLLPYRARLPGVGYRGTWGGVYIFVSQEPEP